MFAPHFSFFHYNKDNIFSIFASNNNTMPLKGKIKYMKPKSATKTAPKVKKSKKNGKKY